MPHPSRRLDLHLGWSRASVSYSFATHNLNSATAKVAHIICVPYDATITECGYRIASRTGNPPQYRIGIQGVGTDGLPDGTFKSSGNAYGTFDPPNNNGWNGVLRWVTLTSSYTATAGEWIAIVVEPDGTTPSGTDYIAVTTTFGNSLVEAVGYVRTYTSSWGSTSLSPCNIPYKTSSGRVVGLASDNFTTSSFGSDTVIGSLGDERGILFTIPEWMCESFVMMGAAHMFSNQTPGTSVKLTLYDGTVPIQQATLDMDETAGANAWRTAYFTEDPLPRLRAGKQYRLAIAPQQTGTGTYCVMYDGLTALEASGLTMPGWHLTYRADGGAWYDDQPGMRPAIEPIIADLTPACAPRTRRKGVKA